MCPHRLRKKWLSLSLGVLMLIGSATVAAEPIAWEGLEDPILRAAQFDLLQGDPFIALTQLKAEQSQGHLKGPPGQVQLTLGGMYLAYGAHHKAAEIFNALGNSDQPQGMRDLAWLRLAQVQYQRREGDKALATLERISTTLPSQPQQERLLLTAILLMQNQRFDEAETYLRQLGHKSLVQQLSEKSVWATYGRFNLAVALHRQGKEQEGGKLLQELGEASVNTEEGQALRDKANLTLAFHYLAKEDPEQARRYFEKTRLQGPMSNKALLGLGRVYSANQQHKNSLVPWLKLIKQNASDPAVQDALLAVPYAFGQLNAFKQALQYYQQALAVFKDEMEQVRQAEASVKKGVLVDSLARELEAQDEGGGGALSDLPNTPGGRYLWQLFATHEFQETLKNYAELRLSLGRLEQWSSEIDINKDLAPGHRQKLNASVLRLQGDVIAMVDRLQLHLQDLALEELEKRKQRLVSYAGEARFSMAQIYDYAAKRWGGEK